MSATQDDAVEPGPVPSTGATITPRVNGPLVVRGDFEILDGSGRAIAPGRRTVALCRCGRSGLKPFCDGSHRATSFRASDTDERPPQH